MATESISDWKRSLSWSVTCPPSSVTSTAAGISCQATISQRAISRATHELGEQRHPVAGLERRVELVLDAEHGVVDEDLDVLAEVAGVPEGGVELGKANAQGLEDRAHGGRRGGRLVELALRGPVTADEAGRPADDLHGNRRRGDVSARCAGAARPSRPGTRPASAGAWPARHKTTSG